MQRYKLTGLTAVIFFCVSSAFAAIDDLNKTDDAAESVTPLAVSLISLEVIGPASVVEQTQTNYTCIAHYADGSSADVTALAEWSLAGSANTGVWIYDLWAAKAESEKHDIPMLYVWGYIGCSYCALLDGYMERAVFQQWMGDRQVIMAYFKDATTATTPEKDFAKYGQNGTLFEYPFVAVYWKSKNIKPYNFTARYTGGNEESKFIAQIESYLGEYVSKPAPAARISGNRLTAASIITNSFCTVTAAYAGLSSARGVKIVNLPEPVLLSSESFETDFGVWTASPGNNFNWSRRTGSTPSGSTGPAGASAGTYYIYTEATGNTPSRTAALEAAFDFSSATQPVLSFDYHMYGANMGTLSVDVYDGTWHNAIWIRSGQQHSAAAAVWTGAEIDLSAYTGGAVKLRVRGVTGSGYTSDMAVDNLRLMEKNPESQIAFTEWAQSEEIPLALRGEADTPAGDGIANLLKYACGLPAMTASSSAELLSIVDDSAPEIFAIRYYRSKKAADVILEPIRAASLSGPWLTTGITGELIGEDESREEWKASIPLGESGFMRLRVTPVE